MIYRIAEPADWARAQSQGRFAGEDLGREGFVHCASRDQAAGVALRYYAGRVGMLWLAVDEALLGDARLVWENTTGGAELFPHVYGPIPIAAVAAVAPLEWSDAGIPAWPAGW